MSRKVSASPWSRNHLNESRWTATKSGKGRTSSRLAKENRSRAMERAAKGFLLRGRGEARRERGRAAAASSDAETRSGRARQPASVGGHRRFSKPCFPGPDLHA